MNRIGAAAAVLVWVMGPAAAGSQPKAKRRLVPRPPQHLLGVRFSPDGQYLLAQDRSKVTILTVKPFGVVFATRARDASLADFTPDSGQVVFLTSVGSLRLTSGAPAHVERWNIADRTRVEFTPIQPHGCSSSGLSPDGRFLVCVDAQGTLRILEVGSSATVFEKKKFGKKFVIYDSMDSPMPAQGNPAFNAQVGDPGSARIDFSPDAHFLIASPKYADGDTIAFDLREKQSLKLQGELKQLTTSVDYNFLSADRMLIAAPTAVVAFPSGEVLFRPRIMPDGQQFRAADPHFVLISPWGPWGHYKQTFDRPGGDPRNRFVTIYTPLEDPGMGAFEIETGQAIVTKNPPLDVFGAYYAAELTDGRLGLYERGKGLQTAVNVADHR